MQESVIYQDIKEQGEQQGKADLVLHLLRCRIGEIESEDETRINTLSVDELKKLGEAIFNFSNRDDLSTWLANH